MKIGTQGVALADYFTESRWGRLLRKELTDAQLAAFSNKLEQRSSRGRRLNASSVVWSGKVCPLLTGEQQIALRESLSGTRPAKPDPLATNPFGDLVTQSESELIQLLGKKTWESLPSEFRSRITR